MSSWKGLAAALALVAAPVAAVLLSSSPRASAADEQPQGRIVEISPDNDANFSAADNEQPAQAPQFWIGLAGRAIQSAALRTHLQLADDVGVLVEQVVPDSPAEKAGLQRHDVIIAVNGEPIGNLSPLQKVVAQGDDEEIELKIMRLAKEETVSVTPAERPDDLQARPPDNAAPGFGQMRDVEDLLRQLQQGNIPGAMRDFGPGMGFGGQAFNPNNLPSGVSVSITRDGDGPAEITVKKGDETWTLKSNDEAAIKKLPNDVRPFVQQMLHGTRPGQAGQLGAMRFDFGDLQNLIPDDLGRFDAEGALRVDQEALQRRADEVRKRTESASQELLERMEAMEKRMQDLQRQLQENSEPSRTNEDDDASKT